MAMSTGTRRAWPIRNVGPLTDEYSLTSDWDNQWRTGGLGAGRDGRSRLDQSSILEASLASRMAATRSPQNRLPTL